MEICIHEKCTGCYACVSTCPVGCISMSEDLYGELHPIIDENRCIQCKACQKACPNNSPLKFSYPMKCYASWITDKSKRRTCASGGIGTIMSEYVIQKGGVMFGSRYDDNLTPIMAYTKELDELERFKGSRYVQSIVGEYTFCNVKSFLQQGLTVLFIGTPCQIAGLLSYLKKDYSNLITVDLICHGCTPTKYFKEEISEICAQKNYSDLVDVRFRGNDGNNYTFSLWGKVKLFPKGKKCSYSHHFLKCLYKRRSYSSYYLGGFLLGVTLRENCYTCSYARPKRISDITIGDFIGLGDTVPFNYHVNNVSSVIINSIKGESFYESVSQAKSELVNVERLYTERLVYKPSLLMPFPKHPLRNEFIKEYIENGYIIASRKILSSEIRKFVKKERKRKLLRIPFLPFRLLRKMLLIARKECSIS